MYVFDNLLFLIYPQKFHYTGAQWSSYVVRTLRIAKCIPATKSQVLTSRNTWVDALIPAWWRGGWEKRRGNGGGNDTIIFSPLQPVSEMGFPDGKHSQGSGGGEEKLPFLGFPHLFNGLCYLWLLSLVVSCDCTGLPCSLCLPISSCLDTPNCRTHIPIHSLFFSSLSGDNISCCKRVGNCLMCLLVH